MNYKYRFEDGSGELFVGNTYAQVVSAMRKSSWQAPGKQRYMAGVAGRIFALDQGQSVVAVENAATFVKSLVTNKWLRRLN